jgi:hypothetical protein
MGMGVVAEATSSKEMVAFLTNCHPDRTVSPLPMQASTVRQGAGLLQFGICRVSYLFLTYQI